MDDVLDESRLADTGTAENDGMLLDRRLRQTYLPTPRLPHQGAGVLIFRAEVPQVGNQGAGGNSLHGGHLIHAQGRVPDGRSLPD